MENLRIQIKIEDNDNLKEAHALLLKLGFLTYNEESFDVWVDQKKPIWLKTNCFDEMPNKIDWSSRSGCGLFKEITLPKLRDMVILKRNNPEDATHACDYPSGLGVKLNGEWYAYNYFEKKWNPWVNDHEYKLKDLKPIEKKEMKEYLDPDNGYDFIKWDGFTCPPENFIEVPEGAEIAYTLKKEDMDFDHNGVLFYGKIKGVISVNSNCTEGWEQIENQSFFDKPNESLVLVWKRETLNDQVASAEEYRQSIKLVDNVNHPSHYTNGKVECIDALEAATVNKTGIEAVCVANVIKYLWRYENKNGIEDIKKAQWYLSKLLSVVGGLNEK